MTLGTTGAVCVGAVVICGCGKADSGLFGLAAAAAPTEDAAFAGVVVVALVELSAAFGEPFANAADGPASPSTTATNNATPRCTADWLKRRHSKPLIVPTRAAAPSQASTAASGTGSSFSVCSS